MKTPQTRPKRHELPPGFVDAIGLDCDSIPIKPYFLRTESREDPHLEGSGVQPQKDGSFRLILQNECAETDEKKFMLELQEALEFAVPNNQNVWWMHNGVRVSTDDEIIPGGAWCVYTERSAEVGN